MRVAAFFSFLCVLAICSQDALAQASVASEPNVESLLAQIEAQDWRQRAKSTQVLSDRIDSDPALGQDERVVSVMTTVLALENSVIAQGNARNEEYIEYYSTLLQPLCVRLFEAGNGTHTGLARALALSAFNPRSKLVSILAGYPDAMLAPTLELLRTEATFERLKAYSLLSEIQRQHRSSGIRSRRYVPIAEDALRRGLMEPEAWMRRNVIGDLVRAGDRGAIPLLKQLAQFDPDEAALPQGSQRSVRATAASAAAALAALPPQ